MECIKVYDKIIITDALILNQRNANKLIGQVAVVIGISRYSKIFPYRVEIYDTIGWVEGIPYSSLMLELF